MSWDAELFTIDGEELGWWNYTYNTTPMVAAAAEAAGISFEGFQRTLNGMDGIAGALMLRRIASELDHIDIYDAMNPPNGWGSREGIARTMRDMADAVPVETPTKWNVT